MRALRLHGAGDLRVDTVADPGPIGPGEVRLRNLLAGICGSDLHEYVHPMLTTVEPHPLTGAALPQILGHEYSAEVLEVGDRVIAARTGDRVAVMPLFFCGECGPCRAGLPQCCGRLGAVGMNWPWGGIAETSVVQEHQVAVLPDAVSDAAGALVEPAAVAVHAVSRAPVRPGDSVLVAGGGPIGQLMCLAALAAGADSVHISEPADGRRRRAEALGAHAWQADAFPDGVDIAIECAGNQPALRDCLAAVRRGGTVVQTALHTKPVELDPRQLTLNDITLRGVNCFPVDSWPRVIELVASGALPVERVVTGVVALGEAVEEGFDALLDPAGDQVKILVDPSDTRGP